MSSVAVRQMPSSIGSVEFSMKKSALNAARSRARCSTGPPLSTFTAPARAGSSISSVAGMTSSCTRRSEKLILRRRLIDDDAHRAFRRMGAHVDQRAGKPLVAHGRHRDQHLPVQEAALGASARASDAGNRLARLAPGFAWLVTVRTGAVFVLGGASLATEFHGEMLPDRRTFANRASKCGCDCRATRRSMRFASRIPAPQIGGSICVFFMRPTGGPSPSR